MSFLNKFWDWLEYIRTSYGFLYYLLLLMLIVALFENVFLNTHHSSADNEMYEEYQQMQREESYNL